VLHDHDARANARQRIKVRSTPGQDTTFTLQIPLQAPETM
jgi:hypothetical protein